MAQQQIIWTAVPNGRGRVGSAEKLMLSVVASPRLRIDGEAVGNLQSFPDFLDWPARFLENVVGFDLIVDEDETRFIPAAIVSDRPADSDLWKALFPADTPVRSQNFEGIKQPIATYPVSSMAGELKSAYSQIGRDSPFRPSDKATFKRNFAELSEAVAPERTDDMRGLRARVRGAGPLGAAQLDSMHRQLGASLLRSDPAFSFDDKLTATIEVAGTLARLAPSGRVVPLVAETGNAGLGFARFAAFHRRASTRMQAQATIARADADAEQIDFHRMLTALGDYTWLMRRLGLVVDLEVDSSLVPRSTIGALRVLRVRPRFTSPTEASAVYMPLTKYILDDTIDGNPLPLPVFLAAPKRAAETPSILPTLEIVGGLLNLRLPRSAVTDDLQFDIVSVDRFLNPWRSQANPACVSFRSLCITMGPSGMRTSRLTSLDYTSHSSGSG
jgi:hypothetical protein